MYRPEIKVIDCTIRDGGLMNKWQFTDEFVKTCYKTCVEAGIDYMEIGYLSSEKAFDRKEVGAWKFCAQEDLKRVVGKNNTPLKLSALADIGRIDFSDIPHKKDSLLDMVRVACYVHQVDKGIELAHHCMEKGYEVTINLMAVSKVSEHDLDEALADLSRSKVPVIYVVDSFGNMYSEQIAQLCQKYKDAMPGKTLGIHAHNNMQLAFGNTIESIIQGVNYLDGTFLGMGRGAGNCHTESLIAFLKNPKYRLKPCLQFIQDYMLDMQKQVTWGFHMPYMVTGMLNEHPRSAIKWMDSDDRNNFSGFLEKMLETP